MINPVVLFIKLKIIKDVTIMAKGWQNNMISN